MRSYRRVTEMDRRVLERELKAGLSYIKIARNLGFHKSTISRELNRNRGGRGYLTSQAQRLTTQRQAYRYRPKKLTAGRKKLIIKLLKKRWSPEQISNRLRVERKIFISHETIYRFIVKDKEDKGLLWKYLRKSYRRRRSRVRSQDPRGKLQNFTPIEERSGRANRRREIGHWERDTMIGKGMMNSLLVLVDRKSRLVKIEKLQTRKALEAAKITAKLLEAVPCLSITNDRGHEFWNHRYVTEKTGAPVYFCNPYASHERGTNENRIGVIRQHLRKKTDFDKVKQVHIRAIEKNINLRPMKCLNWKTPYEVFNGITVALAS